MTYNVVRYWDTYPDGPHKRGIYTLEEAIEECEEARKQNKRHGIDFYVLDSDGVKKN